MNFEIKETRREYLNEIIELLKELSPYSPPKETYESIWASFLKQPNIYSRVAIHKGIIIGYGAIIIETKIRGGRLGHIEDIVSHRNFRNQGIGGAIVNALYEIGRTKDCYKVTLQCKEGQKTFYEKCLFKVGGLGMQRFVIQ